jgi:hypothetical protein
MKARTRTEDEAMLTDYSRDDRKAVYRVLHRHLTEHPELMDNRLLEDLQRSLQKEAAAEGIDVTDHAAWNRWLGNPSGECGVWAANRRLIE